MFADFSLVKSVVFRRDLERRVDGRGRGVRCALAEELAAQRAEVRLTPAGMAEVGHLGLKMHLIFVLQRSEF